MGNFQNMKDEPMDLLDELLKEESQHNKVFAQHDLMLQFILDYQDEFLEHLNDTVEVLNDCEYFNILPYAEKMRDEFASLAEDRKDFNNMLADVMKKTKLPKEGHNL